MFDSIHNVGDYFSEHWLAEAFPTKLKDLAKDWRTRKEHGKHSPLAGLAGAAAGYLSDYADLPRRKDTGYLDALTALHTTLLRALGYEPQPAVLVTEQGGSPAWFPLLARIQAPGGEALHVIQAHPVEGLDDLFADESSEPATVAEAAIFGDPDKKHQTITQVTDVVQRLLLSDDAPRYVLVLAGSWALLTDAARWPEGRYLGFDIATALARRDDKPAGELAWHAGLYSSDVLLPADDGVTRAEEYTKDSIKHAVGVSADLREGLRIAVELIGGAVIDARRAAGQMVEGDDELPGELTRQSLRFLYRILFLLYAEARPELGILPVGAAEYGSGYGLDRFRELCQAPLTTDAARGGHHLHDSLKLLFRLVNDGYRPGERGHDALSFEPLRADLFEPAKARLVDGIDLPNHVLADVLRLLLLSKPDKKRARGYVSYAQLGINQLGAVYEGLMAYSGFIADRDLVELAKDGDPDKGTWLVPVERAGGYDAKHLVMREDRVTGAKSRVVHRKGTFVYRLSGRDRQRSASYYTPEVLTRTVVKHALAELITETTAAAEILDYRVCEPALGSGAFLNEAINQLARAYLDRRQAELGETIEPEAFQAELQKVKAYLALHRCYGVDLNQTAVELAEISVWLNVMHPGLKAPWFGLHLRRGNSLIGARRATYDLSPLARAKQKYWQAVPTDRPLHGNGSGDDRTGAARGSGSGGAENPDDVSLAPLPSGEVHHFLLPADGWGAVGGAKQAKELAPEAAAALRTWRKSMLRKPSKAETDRLRGLAQRVERLWSLALRRMQISEREVARRIAVWGQSDPQPASTVTREQVESALNDPDSPYQRLRLAMDLWCALFFWPVAGTDVAPPDWNEWLGTLEDLLGTQGKAPRGDTVDDFTALATDFAELGRIDDTERALYGMKSMTTLAATRPWVGNARGIAGREGFFHWELDFAQVFARGGFDLQVGNPPWVRLDWQDDVTLAEFDPYFMLTDKIPEKSFAMRRALQLEDPSHCTNYLSELASNIGAVEALSSGVDHPVLAGLRGNLYMSFMERTWRSMSKDGTVGLLHPESHFTDPKAGKLRAATYARLRRHWQFINEAQLFEDVDHHTIYGVHVYGPPGEPSFLQASNLLIPETLEDSLTDDGTGEVPGMQFPWGGWDLRPSRSRIMTVGRAALRDWAALFDPPGTPAMEARLLRPLTVEHMDGLAALSSVDQRLADVGYEWTSCWNEKTDKTKGTIVWRTERQDDGARVILQGPNFFVANPLYKEPNENCQNNLDWSNLDALDLPARFIPRTNYQRLCDPETYAARIPHWNGRPCTDYWRLAWRKMTQPGLERSLISALIPVGPAHVGGVCALATRNTRTTATTAGLWAGIPFDYLVKVGGLINIYGSDVNRFPTPFDNPAAPYLLLRTLRLNCLTHDYAPLWEELYEASFATDSWTAPFAGWPQLGVTDRNWTMDTPLRTDFERRAALVEIDALAAIMLGLTADQLVLMYTGQFGVLRKYEHTMWFDARGDKIAKEHHAMGVRQQKNDYQLLMAYNDGEPCGDLLERYEPPFVQPNREAEMRAAYAEFTDRLGR